MGKAFTNHVSVQPKVQTPTKPKKLHPNIRKLFKDLYKVSMRQKDVQTIEEQRVYGTISSGHKGLDEMMQNSYITRYLTINDMIELYREGISFRLTEGFDSKKIYEAVSEHTGRWREALQYTMNMGKAPVEDLILMEDFISTIYERAKFEYVSKDKHIHSNMGATGAGVSLYDFMYGKGVMRGTSFSSDGAVVSSNRTDNTKSIVDTKHKPDTDVFKRAIVSQMELTSHARRNQ